MGVVARRSGDEEGGEGGVEEWRWIGGYKKELLLVVSRRHNFTFRVR